jgi:hypothetical protein
MVKCIEMYAGAISANKSGSVVLVVFDLHDVVDYNVDAHDDWIETAVRSLYDVQSMCNVTM